MSTLTFPRNTLPMSAPLCSADRASCRRVEYQHMAAADSVV
jgi:hypothetical protein